LLDGLEHGQRAVGVRGRQSLPRLGLDDDARHVVTDGVVQVASKLMALPELRLLDVPHAGGGVEADGGPKCG
jgi:hypothetical protein